MNWTYLQGNWVLCPPNPTAVIHFLGGAFVATAPQITYQKFLRRLANRGYCVIAAPFLVQPNHEAIAAEVTLSFQKTYTQLQRRTQIVLPLPIFGVGHSLGAKLQLLLSCNGILPRVGNLLMSFNNSSSDRAIPFADWMSPVIPLTFSPTPGETLHKVKIQYQQPHTLVLRFKTDTLDDSYSLTPLLKKKFPNTFMNQDLPGNHLTPLGQDINNLDNAALTAPLLGQWLNNKIVAEFSRLEQITLKWLDYQQQLYHRERKI